MGYLLDKDVTELTGNEQFIFDNLMNKEINWFPQSRAIALIKDDFNDEADIHQKIDADLERTRKNMKITRILVEKIINNKTNQTDVKTSTRTN